MVSRSGELTARVVEELCIAARQVQVNAYVPASHFRVGAAVLADDGRIFVGCNVENASLGLTICAERAAVCSAVAAGVRALRGCAIITDLLDPARPCGACRQVLAEFGQAMPIILIGSAKTRLFTLLDKLLPDPFTFGSGAG
ncbi:cytidine deaminase [Planctomycetota bacterium]|nr:cytidine deaminase [Planctomycetota bacterium]